MNIKITPDRHDLTVYDKEHLIHASNKEVLNIDITKFNSNSSFEKAIKVIANLKQLSPVEYNIYRYLLLDSISKDNEMNDSSIIELDKYFTANICGKLCISVATLYRSINNLIEKDILNNIYDSNYNTVKGKYTFVNNFDISTFRNNELKIITITL